MRALILAVGLALAAAAPAPAEQLDDPVAAPYARYSAAIDNGDANAAEAAAQEALTASQARDGDGGRTGVLAYNLANLRLDADRPAEAYEPAQLALRVAESRGPPSGVDLLAARLAFAQAELAVAPDRGSESLRAALDQAAHRNDLDDRAFRAAAALGSWAFATEQYALAHAAWAHAARHVSGATPSDVLARARARTAEAVSLIAQHAQQPGHSGRDQAYAILTESVDALYPFALEQAADGALTPFQTAYGEALGWRSYGRAAYTPRAEPNRRTVGGDAVCAVRWSGNNMLPYTLQMAYHGDPGVAVFRILTDESGRITQADIAYAAPEQDFSRSITPALSRLRARRAESSTEGCTMPRVHFQAVVFSSGR